MASRIDRFREIAAKAAERTNAELSSEISALTPLTEAQIERIVPTKADKAELARLMEIVSSSASTNKKVATLEANISDVGEIALRILRAVMLV